jgi:glutamate carboxypeptidase
VAQIDVRFRTLKDGDRVCDAVDRLRPEDSRIRLELERGGFYPPLERTPAVIAAFHAARDAARDLGLPPLEEISTGGASEASFGAALGLPTLDGLGADGDGAHAVDEHVVLASLAERTALAATLIQKLSSSPNPKSKI